MRPLALALSLALVTFSPAVADGQDGPVRVDFAGDTYSAGMQPPLPSGPTGALFAMGETLDALISPENSAHLIGRRVIVGGAVGGDLYAAGLEVDIAAPVAGDATVAARVLRVSAPVAGVLRVIAADLTIDAPVGALLAGGERIRIDAVIRGDARIHADSVEFGPNGRIDGRLILAERHAAPAPPSAIPAERVERVASHDAPTRSGVAMMFGAVAAFLATSVITLIALAVLLGAAPRWSEDIAFDVAERPFRSLGAGFLTLAAIFGAIPLLVVTLIGIPLVVVLLALIPFALLAGHALGVWSLGAAVWRAMDRPAPDGFGSRMGIALIGLVVAVLLGLIPVLGWLLGLGLTLLGVGAAAARILAGRSL